MYLFSDVTFDDGGTLTGTFTTNDPMTALLDFDITTSPGADIGFNYTPATASSVSTSLPFILVLTAAIGSLGDTLQVTFDSLTASGSLITIGTFDSFEQTIPTRRNIVAGEVIVASATVPEPSTLALAAIGGVLGLLNYVRRRRRT